MEFIEAIDWHSLFESGAVLAVLAVTVWGGSEGVVVAVQKLKMRLGWRGGKAQALAAIVSFVLALAVILATGVVLPDVMSVQWLGAFFVGVLGKADAIYQRIMRDG